MNIIYNNQPCELPEETMTVEQFLEWKDVRKQGTAVAINNRIIRKDAWAFTTFQSLDRVSVISAAFGG